MTPFEIGQAVGGVVKLLALLWFVLALVVSCALPFMAVSAVRSLRRISAALERIADHADRAPGETAPAALRRFNVLTP